MDFVDNRRPTIINSIKETHFIVSYDVCYLNLILAL